MEKIDSIISACFSVIVDGRYKLLLFKGRFDVFGLSAGEILLIALIVLILFGNDKLPENMKKFYLFMTQVKKFFFNMNQSWYDIKNEIKEGIDFSEEKEKLKELKELTKPTHLVETDESISGFSPNSNLHLEQVLITQEEIDDYQNDIKHEMSNTAPKSVVKGPGKVF